MIIRPIYFIVSCTLVGGLLTGCAAKRDPGEFVCYEDVLTDTDVPTVISYCWWQETPDDDGAPPPPPLECETKKRVAMAMMNQNRCAQACGNCKVYDQNRRDQLKDTIKTECETFCTKNDDCPDGETCKPKDIADDAYQDQITCHRDSPTCPPGGTPPRPHHCLSAGLSAVCECECVASGGGGGGGQH